MQQGDMLRCVFGEGDFSPELVKRYNAARKELDECQRLMRKEAAETPVGMYMKKMGSDFNSTKTHAVSGCGGNTIVTFSCDRCSMAVAHTPFLEVVSKPQVHRFVDPATVNSIIGGKLLSAQEKRRFLKKVLPEQFVDVWDDNQPEVNTDTADTDDLSV